MLLDLNLVLSNNQLITATAASQGLIDLTGQGVGNAPVNSFGVQNSVFGEDIGIGDGVSPPLLVCIVGTALTGATSLQVQLQASVDSGSTGSPAYSPNAWENLAETDAIAAATLTAGQKIAEFTIPPRYPGQSFPRFYRLNYVVAGGPFTGGTIGFAGFATGRDDYPWYPAAY